MLSAFSEFPLPVANSDPGDLTVGPDGNFWFPYGKDFVLSHADPGIGRITPSGAVTTFPIPDPGSGYGRPGDLTVGPDGNLWFLGATGLGRITPSGAITVFPLASGGTGKLTVGPDGNLWLPERSPSLNGAPGAIVRITPAGATTVFALTDAPGDLTVGPDGNLWFPEFSLNGAPGAIVRITPAGATTVFALTESQATRAI